MIPSPLTEYIFSHICLASSRDEENIKTNSVKKKGKTNFSSQAWFQGMKREEYWLASVKQLGLISVRPPPGSVWEVLDQEFHF